MTDFKTILEEARTKQRPIIALRPDRRFPDELDDIVVLDVENFHMEAMSDKSWWIGLNLKDDHYISFNIHIAKKPQRIVVQVSEEPGEYQDWDELYHQSDEYKTSHSYVSAAPTDEFGPED